MNTGWAFHVMLSWFGCEIIQLIHKRDYRLGLSSYVIMLWLWNYTARTQPAAHRNASQIARFMGPTWGPPRSCRPQMGPVLAPWTLLSGVLLPEKKVWSRISCNLLAASRTQSSSPPWSFSRIHSVSKSQLTADISDENKHPNIYTVPLLKPYITILQCYSLVALDILKRIHCDWYDICIAAAIANG